MPLDNLSPDCWFRLDCRTDRLVVTFLPNPDDWAPNVLNDQPIPVTDFRGRRVLLRGKVPLWMYGHVTARAVRAGAAEIAVFQPQLSEPVIVYPLPPAAETESEALKVSQLPGETLIGFQRSPSGCGWTIESLALPDAEAWSPLDVTFTGPAANWMISAAVAAAAQVPTRRLWHVTPREQDVISMSPELLDGDSGARALAPSGFGHGNTIRGVIIGVVGDPNSGKSLVSRLLLSGFDRCGLGPAWRCDCDYAAETADWYLDMMARGREEEAGRLRAEYKRTWTADAERRLAGRLSNCARRLAWTIADLPGGIHSETRTERIPPGREILLQPIDRFVIVRRSDRADAEAGWRDELARCGLEDRVCAVIESGCPDQPHALQLVDGEPVRATVSGLDRRRMEEQAVSNASADWAALAQRIAASVGGRAR